MENRSGHQVDVQHSTHQQTSTISQPVADQIGPRVPGVVYYDGPRLVQVLDVITDTTEARRILRRNAARFAVLIQDLHDSSQRYTGATWTGSDRVLKAVAA